MAPPINTGTSPPNKIEESSQETINIMARIPMAENVERTAMDILADMPS